MVLFRLLTVTLCFHRQVSGRTLTMDILRHFQNVSWCKPDWCYPSMGKETNELLRQCIDLPKLELCNDVDELIRRSKAFPVPFPIETVRLEKLKVRRPIEKLRSNVVSTYPIIHERVLLLMTHFLIYKREFGTSIEKAFYKDMTVPELIDRILKKRAAAFLSQHDHYKLLSGEEDYDGWEAVGTLQQKPPLLLENCLSYDEIKLSALVYVSGPTECINNGTRTNSGVVSEENAERDAIIIGIIGTRFARKKRMEYEDIAISELQNCPENGYGEEVTPTTCLDFLKTAHVRNNESARRMWRQMWAEFYQNIVPGIVGPRFERENRMEYEDVLITEHQNCPENGYGEEVTPTTCLNVLKTTYVRNNQSARHMWRQIWAEFYQVHSYTYEELISYVSIQDKPVEDRYVDRYVKIPQRELVFDNEVYYKRVSVTAECVLFEAEERARVAGRAAYVNIIGAGLGVWKVSSHQNDVYILTILERIRAFLKKDLLNHVTDVNFAYIQPSNGILALFTNAASPGSETHSEKKIFFESKRHPRGGINVQLENREPSAKLTGEHEGKLLVMTYPWDGNAHPGNEFWLGALSGSGDPAAACSTQVAELHNAHVNPAVGGVNTRVAGRSGVRSLSEYAQLLTA